MSEQPRTTRVRRSTSDREVAARWSARWKADLIQVVPHGDLLAVAGNDADGDARFAVVSRSSGTVEKRAKRAGCAVLPAPGAPLLVAVCGEHELVALDPTTLATRWRYDGQAQIRAVAGNPERMLVTTILSAEAGAVAAVSTRGEELWRTTVPSKFPLGVAEDAQRVYVYETDPTVWALDGTTGEVLWEAPEKENIATIEPRPDGSLAVYGVSSAKVLDADGKIARTGVDRTVDAGAWPWDISITADTSYLEGRNVETGAIWTYATAVASVVGGARGTVYVCTREGVLHAVDSSTGAGRWHAVVGPYCDGRPVQVSPDATGGFLVAVDDRLIAFDPAKPSLGRMVTIRGRFVPGAGEQTVAGLSVTVGDQVVETDNKGRFRVRVREGTLVTLSMSEGLSGQLEPVTVLAQAGRKVRLESVPYEPG